ncbi:MULTISPECIES: hypothetical protein [Pseudomonadaceae]|uniref:hypothetical protein n=1 Tax=Pseudomonadaceae TaxID=135621 RepID=UPI00241D0F4F|nr:MULTISPECIES: hypothetical protein [Pseudomonadaceae]
MIEDRANELFISAASIWEIGQNAMGKASFQFDSGVLRRSLLDGDYKELSVTSRHAITAAASPLLHSAHLIGCSSDTASEGFILVTNNHATAKYSGPIKHVG